MNAKLSETERNLFNYLRQRMPDDVSIAALHKHIYGEGDDGVPRNTQQRIGAIVSRVNKKVSDYRIRPGTARQSYCITKA